MTDLYFVLFEKISDSQSLALLAFLGGIIPAILWLLFWLREDKKRPEPKLRILLTFISGMLAGVFVIPIQQFLGAAFFSITLLFVFSAFAEELFKYIAANLSALKTKVADEPIDGIIYLITAALGFSALENSLYLLTFLFEESLLKSLILANFRFIGPSLLHTAASGILGIFIAFSFYKKKFEKNVYITLGLILATGLHVIFNLLIINGELLTMLSILLAVWVVIAIILVFFEKVKTLPIKN